jgi:hypothetical protein
MAIPYTRKPIDSINVNVNAEASAAARTYFNASAGPLNCSTNNAITKPTSSVKLIA